MGYIAEQNGFSCIGWLPVFFFFFPFFFTVNLISVSSFTTFGFNNWTHLHIPYSWSGKGKVHACMHSLILICTYRWRHSRKLQKLSLSFCLSLPHSLSLPLFICSFFSLFPSLVLVHICHNYSSISFKRNHFILNIVLMN